MHNHVAVIKLARNFKQDLALPFFCHIAFKNNNTAIFESNSH